MEPANQKILIERYFRNELSAEELQGFQQQLETDQAFAQAVAVEQDIVDTLRIKEQQRFRQRLTKIHTEEIKETPIKSLFNRRWLMAASIAILLGVSFFLWTNNQPLSSQEIFAANYEQPSLTTARTGENNAALAPIKTAYEQANYATATKLINDLLAKEYDGNLALVLGACYLENNQIEDAITIFETIQQQTDLADDALWYLGLAHLKKGDKAAAKQQFTNLLAGTIPVTPKRKAKVEQILNQLE